jgi:small subunit ribosomal protein S8e
MKSNIESELTPMLYTKRKFLLQHCIKEKNYYRYNSRLKRIIMKWQGRSTRKYTGGRLVRSRSKRRFELGREPANTHLGETIRKTVKTMGGREKIRLLRDKTATVIDAATKTAKKVKIETVTGNPANIHYVRRNIVTKGSIIKTEIGSARVTNRPGQEGCINAVLIPSTA